MATAQGSNITASSLTVSGTTQKTGTISWTKPTVPSDATITSCVLTGTATASMSKGSATITVNGTTVTSGSQFTINLGTSNNTTSVTTTAKGGNKNADGTVSFSNLVYTVTYTEYVAPTIYTVTFVDWNGTTLKTQEVEEGSSATAPSNPTRQGYTFTGWDKTFTNVTSDLTVTAKYDMNTYKVTFKDYDGTTLKTQTVNYGGNATPPSDPVRDGYTFTGWDTAFDNVISDLTVTAQYTQNSSGGGEEPEEDVIEWSGIGTVATNLYTNNDPDDCKTYKINIDWDKECLDILVKDNISTYAAALPETNLVIVKIGEKEYSFAFSDGAVIFGDYITPDIVYDMYGGMPVPFTLRLKKEGVYIIFNDTNGEEIEAFAAERNYVLTEPIYITEDPDTSNSLEFYYDIIVSAVDPDPEPGEESYAPFTITSYTDFDEDLGQNFLYIRNPNNTVNIANLTTALSSADEQTISFEPDTSTTYYEGNVSINFDLSSYSNITKAELVAVYSNNNVNYAADFSGTRITIDGTTVTNLYTDSANFVTETFDVTTQVQNKTAVTCKLICDFAGSYSLSRIIEFYPSMDVDYIGLKITEGSPGGGGEPEGELVTKTEALRPNSVTQDSGYNNTWTNPANTYDTDTSTSGTLIVTGSSQSGFKRKYVDTVFNFDTSHIPADATINSATLTIRAKQSATTNLNMTASINGNDVIASTLLSSSSANYTADVKDYVKGLGQLNVNLTSAATSNRTFTLYDVRIDVEYSYYEVSEEPDQPTIPADHNSLTIISNEDWGYVVETNTGITYTGTNIVITAHYSDNIDVRIYANEGYEIVSVYDPLFGMLDEGPFASYPYRAGASLDQVADHFTLEVTYAKKEEIVDPDPGPGGGETTYISKLHIGELIIDKLYLGEFSVEKIYIGEVLLFGKDVNE